VSTDTAAALVALLDQAMAEAARGREGVDRRDFETIDLHLSVLHRSSGVVTARAQVTGGGRSICFCEAQATDAAGRTVAQAMGTYRAAGPAA
jgi:acyl-coenzyme A thioesterase PaaI-like protein